MKILEFQEIRNIKNNKSTYFINNKKVSKVTFDFFNSLARIKNNFFTKQEKNRFKFYHTVRY